MPTKTQSKTSPKFIAPAAPSSKPVVESGPVVGFTSGSIRVENMTGQILSFVLKMADGGEASITLGPTDDRMKDDAPIPADIRLNAESVAALRTHHGFKSAEARGLIRVG